MVSFLLDANVVSELRKPVSVAEASVRAWAGRQRPHHLAVSAVTLYELECGVRRVELRDPAQGDVLRAWLDGQVKPAFAGRVLPLDEGVAVRAASLQVPQPRPAMDTLIAATALVHGLVLVTRNVKDFAPTGVRLLNPWEE